MTKRTGSSNEHLRALITELRTQGALNNVQLWRRIADDLEKPSRQRREVNVSRIDRCTEANDIVVVPGKVLGTGNIAHQVTVGAFAFSETAKESIENAKGKCVSIQELLKKNLKGQKVKIIG